MFWRRLRHLTPAEMLLLNMAVIHLFLAVASYPAAMAASFSHRWLFGDLGCAMYGFTCYFVGIATITSLLALAVVRYMKTCMHPYGRSLSADHIKIILIGIYLYSLFWALLPLTSIGSYEVEPFGTSCTLNWADPSNAGRLYIIAAVLVVVIIPCLVIIWCYVKIFLLVRRNQKKKMMLGKRSGASQPSQLQMSLVSCLVCLGFILAWIPYAVVSIYFGLGGHPAPPYVAIIPVLLAKSSCAYNPIIYIFVTPRYRSEILDVVRNCCSLLCCTDPNPSQDKASGDVRLQVVGVEAKDSADFQQRHIPMISQAPGTHTSSVEENSETPSVCSEALLPDGQKPSEASTLQDPPQDLPNGHSSTIDPKEAKSPEKDLPKEEAQDGRKDRNSSDLSAARESIMSQAECMLSTTAVRPPTREGQATTHSVYTTAMSGPRVNSVELPSTMKSDLLAASLPASESATGGISPSTVESQGTAISNTPSAHLESPVIPQTGSPSAPTQNSSLIRPTRPTVLPL
ncbi:opsin-5-like [Penaeus monodon]|uniref:opsin-5-like n=1 Tax=Penaeus monodon TaxID=6687 RepID=UPI0018A6F2DC|nr:opsin-5-like [Penaeus monodon]